MSRVFDGMDDPPASEAYRPETDRRGTKRAGDVAMRAGRSTKGFLAKLWDKMGEENISLMAAGVAFYCFLSLVPLLGAVILSYGLIADPATVSDHIKTIISVVPKDAAKLILSQLVAVVTASSGKTGLGLILALLLAVYGATRASSAIMAALNVIYGQREQRSIVMGTAISFGIIIGAVVTIITGLLAATLLGWLQDLLSWIGPVALFAIKVGTWAVAALLASAAIGATYRFGPSKAPKGWRWVSMGSGIATLLWLSATIGLGVYVAKFGNYNATYGSLSAVVVLLMWFYVSAYAILLGATINAVLWPQQRSPVPASSQASPASS